MKIRIHYRHISHGKESTEDILDWLTQFFERAVHISPMTEKRGLLLDVYFSKSKVRKGTSKAVYECHMLARAPWLKKELFNKTYHEEFWSALTEASHVLKKQINKYRLNGRSAFRQRIHEDLSIAG